MSVAVGFLSQFAVSFCFPVEYCPLLDSVSWQPLPAYFHHQSPNQKNRKYLLAEGPKYPEYAAKNNVKIIGQYHVVLEHSFVWILEAEDAQTVEKFAMEAGLSSFNALKIVHMSPFKDALPKMQMIEDRLAGKLWKNKIFLFLFYSNLHLIRIVNRTRKVCLFLVKEKMI